MPRADWQIYTFFDIDSKPHRISAPKIREKRQISKELWKNRARSRPKELKRRCKITLRRGSLDESYERDQIQSVIEDLSYSNEDAARKLEKHSKLKFRPRVPKSDERYFLLLKNQYDNHRRLVERYKNFRTERRVLAGDVPTALAELPPETPLASDYREPERVETTTYRILRDTRLARRVKELHNHECQICGEAIEMADGNRYAEAHHIQPLGAPHNGPDRLGNIICVCPNHHVMLDYFSIPMNLDEIKMHKDHKIENIYLLYHNQRHKNESKP